MIDEYLDDTPQDAGALKDVALIESIVQDAARDGRAISYSEFLMLLGMRFSRPKMRTLCKTLDEVDRRAAANGEPELAVLVVRESDRLPGQGWWIGRTDYVGPWEGAEARAHIAKVQARAFSYWQSRRSG